MIHFKAKSSGKLEKELQQMLKASKELSRTTAYPLTEVFSPVFMKSISSFSSIDDFFTAGGFEVKTQEDLKTIPEETLDAHVRATTSFQDWEDMFSKAVSQFTSMKLKS